ncbi:cell adhesion molecule CEACAM16-like [Stigmatopora argus]
MDTKLLWTSIILLLPGSCQAQNVLPAGPLSGAVSDRITFKTTLQHPELPFLSVSWTFKGVNVITSTNRDVLGDGYTNRITLDRSTGSLELRGLSMADSGEYVVTIIPQEESQKQGKITLNVYVPVSGVTVRGPSGILIENKHTASITCEASGSVSSRVWTKDGQYLRPGPTISFSPDNEIVIIRPVRSNDHGVYQCKASNPISTVAAAFNLTINFGPHNVSILGPSAATPGRKVTFRCWAYSFPPARFHWQFNGNSTNVNGSSFVVEHLNDASVGNYTCTAKNVVTQRENSTIIYLRASCAIPCWSILALLLSATSSRWIM